MQQGACNAPATMMRAMSYLFWEVENHMIYLDDILIANNSYEEHINTIKHVLQMAKEKELSFNWHKCQFMPDNLAILGDYFPAQALEADPDKVRTILQFSKPHNRMQLQRFLGMVNSLR